MPRDREPCAEPGCTCPAARGSYCAEHAALYYVRPRGMMMSAERIQKLDAAPDLGASGSSLAQSEDRVRLHLRWAQRSRPAGWN